MKDGTFIERKSGAPQGGVISPVLSNLFLHYAFDRWITVNFQQNPWARYADDAVVYCGSKAGSEVLLKRLDKRFNGE